MARGLEFTKIGEGVATSDDGTTVAFSYPGSILYSNGSRSIAFSIERTQAFDDVDAYVVKVPYDLTWTSTGERVNSKEFKCLRGSIIDALKLFNALPIFVSKEACEEYERGAKAA